MANRPLGTRAAFRATVVGCGLLGLCGLFGLLSGLPAARAAEPPAALDPARVEALFGRKNLVAWCIVPFDAKKRTPPERVAMLGKLGFTKYAYDWRAEHLPGFEQELDLLKAAGIELNGLWFPGGMNKDAQFLLDVLKRKNVRTRLWVTGGGGPTKTPEEQAARVKAEADRLRPIAEAAANIGCTLGLYNHGGWFGEPDNQLAILAALGRDDVGIIYNFHHAHGQIDRLAETLRKFGPRLAVLNLNGMLEKGDERGAKLLPLGLGDDDRALLETVVRSGWSGPVGILGHTQDDAEARLLDNLDGLEYLKKRLLGRDPGPVPVPRTPLPKGVGAVAQPVSDNAVAAPAPANAPVAANAVPYDPQRVQDLAAAALVHGDAKRGALVFGSIRFACVSCHKIGPRGGDVGPDLTQSAATSNAVQLAEGLLYPKRQVKPEYEAWNVLTVDGKSFQGYRLKEDAKTFVLKEVAGGNVRTLPLDEIDDKTSVGSLMPEGLAAAMSEQERRDVLRFLVELPKDRTLIDAVPLPYHPPTAAKFAVTNAPLQPEAWPHRGEFVNRDRLYDFYAKQARHFVGEKPASAVLGEYPGLDAGRYGHWGNQEEKTWADDRWNATDVGNLLGGIFRGAGKTVPKGICLRLGEQGEASACFDPQTLTYPALWRDGFVNFSSVRHGFMSGLALHGTPLPAPAAREKANLPTTYRGFYRHGKRVIFAYRVGDEEILDAPWFEEGKFVRTVGPAANHPAAALTRGGPAQWPQVFEFAGKLGTGKPYAVDTIPLPFENPWKALLFVGDHAFLPDGSAYVCTMQGDVWKVDGLDAALRTVRWRRFASGLHQPLGMIVFEGLPYVLGRDQITRLHDLNGDGEADFYQCVSNAYVTSPAGHDFICGLERDSAGNFWTASGNQGLIKISPDGKTVHVAATGFRNPDGLGLTPDGTATVPCSEGDWTPSSMICETRPDGHYGYRGPRDGKTPDLPLVYLPRGLDNSSGGQTVIPDDRWGPLRGLMVHASFGACTHFLLLRDRVEDQPQGAIVPLPGDFASGAHRLRFNPADGQLYVSGMAGWGSYATADGSFQRVRYVGGPVRLPVGWKAHANGVRVTFAEPLSAELPGAAEQFVQCWNYRYGPGYGSPEYSPSHRGLRGHDRLSVTGIHRGTDGKSFFLEIPDLQPVNQLHLHLKIDGGEPIDLFATVHKLAEPYTDFPQYRPTEKKIAPHPIHADILLASKSVPNPFVRRIAGAEQLVVEAGKNLTFLPRILKAKAGQPLQIKFKNPDVVPHNWVLLKPGTLAKVGEQANKLVSDPEAAIRHYVPPGDDVLAYTDIVDPQGEFLIHFRAPKAPGRYPFLCTFPGHWMVMNGELVVE